MFDFFSWQHLSIMLIVALVVVGPKDLPRLMNMAGKWAGKARAMAGEFRRSFDEMARESELAELRKEIEDLKKNNPVTEVANTMSGVQADIGNPMEGAGIAAEPAEAAAPVAAEPRSGEFQVTDTPQQPAPGTPSSLQA
jgi:sec-independent protein translocase protein TatB